jgi:hypothetical protein
MEECIAQVVVDFRRAWVQAQSTRIERQAVIVKSQSYVGVRRAASMAFSFVGSSWVS